MTINYTPLLSLAEPVTGTQSGTWGDDVNQGLTDYLDIAVAGTQTISGSQTAVTLSKTTGSASASNIAQVGSAGTTGTAQYAVIRCNGNPASLLTITAPATSKTYVVINATSTNQSVKLVGPGPTTGVTVPSGKSYLIAWSGSDFAIIGTATVNLATDVTGILPVANGGTGQSTYTDGQLLIGNSTGNTLTKTTLTASTGISVTNGSGAITITNTAPDQTVVLTGAGATTTSGTYPNFTISSVNTTYGTATLTVNGLIKLGSNTAQSTAANAVTSTASRTYALQLNASGEAGVNVPWTDTTYTLPAATSTVLGGIELGSDTVQSVAANSVTATASRTYALQINAAGQAVVNVPWTANSPGGSTTQVQYNSAGAFAGSANMTFNGTALSLANDATISGLTVGRGGGSVSSNTAVGTSALASATSVVSSTAIGFQAGNQVTSTNRSTFVGNTAGYYGNGDDNVAVGRAALYGAFGGSLSINTRSTAVGNEALYYTEGSDDTVALGYRSQFNAIDVTENTAVGTESLFNNALGDYQTAMGYRSMYNMLGDSNTALGHYSMRGSTTPANNTGQNNVAVGVNSLLSLSSGSTNCAVGVQSLQANTTASNNTAVGYQASYSNTTGANNVAVGYQAGYAALTAVQQTAIGYRALATNTITAGVGYQYEGSTAVGYKALELYNPSILSYSTAVGAGALANSTTGGQNTAVGAGAAYNLLTATSTTAIGALAGFTATTGNYVAVGAEALRYATNQSSGSTAVGVSALKAATTWSGSAAVFNRWNTAIGYAALISLDAESTALGGSNNTALGYNAGGSLTSGSNNTILGYQAQASTVSVSNEITLGNSSVTTLRCQVTSITSLSDQRDKHSIEDLPVGLNLINALRPRRYKWDKRDWYVNEVEKDDGTVETVAVPQDGSRAQNEWNEGFVAQEAKAALQSLGADWFPLVYESNPEKLEMSSGKLIPVLVKAIQELTARLEALEAK